MNRFSFFWHLDNHPHCVPGKLFVFHQIIQTIISVTCVYALLAAGQSLATFLDSVASPFLFCFILWRCQMWSPCRSVFGCIYFSAAQALRLQHLVFPPLGWAACSRPGNLGWSSFQWNEKEFKLFYWVLNVSHTLEDCSVSQHSTLWFLPLWYQYL